MMTCVFLGATTFSEAVLNSLISQKSTVVKAVFAVPKTFSISYSKAKVRNTNFADLKSIAKKLKVPYHEINGTQGHKLSDYEGLIKKINPDVILVMGWYYMIPASIRNLSKYGAWGIHASLLPDYAGGAPLVWAMINGENQTGVSLFKLSDGVDDGDIIAQKKIKISANDNIKTLYDKATHTSIEILNTSLKQGVKKIKITPQNLSKQKIYPQRSPADGKIDWTWSADNIRNFIRAQTKPYLNCMV
ncbi:MAG: methionyl-tRNA formyltransferase [Bacteroidetes bacterium]|nr:methionyl-tRNA formyltransferase [Bacteroidota bacterium]